MATRQQVIDEARQWLGTPWRHQGRLKGVGCDCVGHILMVPVALGLLSLDCDIAGYPRWPEPSLMGEALDKHLDRVERADLRGADVLWLKPRRVPHHLAIYTFDDTIIHAIDLQRGVTEHRLDERWRAAIARVYRYRGLED